MKAFINTTNLKSLSYGVSSTLAVLSLLVVASVDDVVLVLDTAARNIDPETFSAASVVLRRFVDHGGFCIAGRAIDTAFPTPPLDPRGSREPPNYPGPDFQVQLGATDES